VSNKYANLLEELEEHIEQGGGDDLTPWEMGFVDSIRMQLDAGQSLTVRQKEKLADIHERRVLGY